MILFRRLCAFLFLSALLYVQTKQERTDQALFAAIRENSTDKVIALLKQGADPNARDAQGLTPLQVIFEIKPRLVGKEIWARPMPENLPLLTALLVRGAHVHVRAKYGRTPLFIAASFQYAQSVKLLLEHGADVNVRDNYGLTPLIGLAISGTPPLPKFMETLQVLLVHGADANAQDSNGREALMYLATRGGCAEIIQGLMDKGAKVDIRDRFGGTVLMDAGRCGHPEYVKILLAHSAAVNRKDKQGKSALAYAQEGLRKHSEDAAQYKAIIALLKQAGAKE